MTRRDEQVLLSRRAREWEREKGGQSPGISQRTSTDYSAQCWAVHVGKQTRRVGYKGSKRITTLQNRVAGEGNNPRKDLTHQPNQIIDKGENTQMHLVSVEVVIKSATHITVCFSKTLTYKTQTHQTVLKQHSDMPDETQESEEH